MGRLLWVGRCELVAVGQSLWIGCCEFVTMGCCESIAIAHCELVTLCRSSCVGCLCRSLDFGRFVSIVVIAAIGRCGSIAMSVDYCS